MAEPQPPQSSRADALHRLLRSREGELVSSKEILLAVGREWRDALKELQRRGVAVESAVGASGNWSFRILSKDKARLKDFLDKWAGSNLKGSGKPDAVVLPEAMRGSASETEARALGVRVFYGAVDFPLFVVEACSATVEHEHVRPRPDALY